MIGSLLTGDIKLTVTQFPEHQHGRKISIQVHLKGQIVGWLDVTGGELVHPKLKAFWCITHVEVLPEVRRQGVSAKMREAALRLTCAAGKRLASDTVRSGFEEAFWAALRERGEVDLFDLRSGQLSGIDDDGFNELDEEEMMYEQQDYDYVYVMRCPR